MNIALWNYGSFGRKTSESLLKYWGGRYTVTKIYDSSKTGKFDRFWNIEISDTARVKADYERGLFEKIIVCLVEKPPRDEIIADLTASGVPVLFPGDPADFISSDDFCTEIKEGEKGSRIYRCHDVMAARADHYNWECLYVFDQKGRILKDPWAVTKWYDSEAPLIYPFPFKDPVPEKIRMSGPYCLLTKIFGNNYWHFTFQSLCDVYFLERSGFTGTYIVPNAHHDRELMIMMGISPDRILSIDELSNHKVYVFEEIYGVQFDYHNNDLEASVMADVSRIIKNRLRRDPSYPKYIYVKRIGLRKLINGDEFAERYHFVTIIPEKLSVKEQMEYFYNADIVLCPHGANSTNCLYMHENSVFIEVFSDRWFMDINTKVCHENRIFHLKTIGKAEGKTKIGIHDDYSIQEHRIVPVIQKSFSLIPDPPIRQEDLSSLMGKANPKIVCSKSEGILIYGAWILGERAFDMIKDSFGEKMLGFAVTAKEGNPEEKNGYPVRTVEEWTKHLSDRKITPEQVTVFLGLNPVFHDEIRERLNENGYINIFMPEELDWY